MTKKFESDRYYKPDELANDYGFEAADDFRWMAKEDSYVKDVLVLRNNEGLIQDLVFYKRAKNKTIMMHYPAEKFNTAKKFIWLINELFIFKVNKTMLEGIFSLIQADLEDRLEV